MKVLPDMKEIIMLGQAHMANLTNPMEAKIKIKFNNSTEGKCLNLGNQLKYL